MKLPLRGRITYRHCRQPKPPNFLLSSNRLFGGGAADADTTAPIYISVCRRCRNEPRTNSTTTPTKCLRLMQWNASKNSDKITELLTFLHSNNVNIAAIQETKMTNKTKPLKMPGGAAVRLDRHKNKGGGLQTLIKDTIPIVDNTAALSHSADPHLEQQGISITISQSPTTAHPYHLHSAT